MKLDIMYEIYMIWIEISMNSTADILVRWWKERGEHECPPFIESKAYVLNNPF